MKIYPAHIWKDTNGAYSVEFPDLPGCFSSGDTVEEAKTMAYEALTGYLESLASRKLPIPEPSFTNNPFVGASPNEYITPITVGINTGNF
jgi:predicted RNase H-like HicB family nuclease